MATAISADDLRARTRRAVQAATGAAEGAGLPVTDPVVLHDAFSVVVRLDPSPVVARVPVVQPPFAEATQHRRQQRELAVAAWLAEHGHPVVAPSTLLPMAPVQRDGVTMTFWEAVRTAPEHEPYRDAGVESAVRLHAALADYPGDDLGLLTPMNEGMPALLTELAPGLLTAEDVHAAHREWEGMQPWLTDADALREHLPGATVQPIQGDGPQYNVIESVRGPLFSDFEDVTLGPVEWDLALLPPEVRNSYDTAAADAGRPGTDPDAAAAMDRARMLQLVCCAALVPQMPVLGAMVESCLATWRSTLD